MLGSFYCPGDQTVDHSFLTDKTKIKLVSFPYYLFAVETVILPEKRESGKEEISTDKTKDEREIPADAPAEEPKQSSETKIKETQYTPGKPLCVLGVSVGTKQETKSEPEKAKSSDKYDDHSEQNEDVSTK